MISSLKLPELDKISDETSKMKCFSFEKIGE
jgi:hypothetical protein